MSWIALTDGAHPVFNIRGIGVDPGAPGARGPMQDDELLPVGTMMLEFRSMAAEGGEQVILAYRRHRDWTRELRLALDASGRISLQIRQGRATCGGTLPLPSALRDGPLRLTYAWNAPARIGWLTVEVLDSGQMFRTELADPLPLPAEDVRVIIRNGRRTQLGGAVSFLAFSDEIEPVGFGAGILGETGIETENGMVRVDRLRPGDRVRTLGSGFLPVRHVGRRTVPALGRFRPVRLRQQYFGLWQDVVIAPDHKVQLGLPESEYLIGDPEVLLAARHLANARHARAETRRRLVTYYQILLDVHECVNLAGLWAETLFVGTIARRPDLVKHTILAPLPISAIPLHRERVRRGAREFEAQGLASALHAG